MSDFDPDAFLEGKTSTPVEEKTIKNEPAKGFDPDAFLGENKTTKQTINKIPEQTPMPQFAVPGPTGINPQAIGQTLTPLVEAGKGALGGYVKNPATALIDVGAMHFGIPPPYASVQTGKGLYNVYNAAKESLQQGRQVAGAVPEASSSAFNTIAGKLKPEDLNALGEIVKSKGGKVALETYKLPEYLANDADALAALNVLKSQAGEIPGAASRILGPVLRGAGKVLGPAGLAMNAYDAAQYAQAAELGKRLAAGQGGIAQQAFRNVQHTAGAQYQLQPQEAANVLASGDAATINLYGGPERLNQIAGGQSPMAAPTSTNFIDRMRAMAHQYNMIGNQQ